MTFAEYVRWAVHNLGMDLREGGGTKLAAKATGASDRQIRRWMDGEKPKHYAECGARVLLREAVRKRCKELKCEPLQEIPR